MYSNSFLHVYIKYTYMRSLDHCYSAGIYVYSYVYIVHARIHKRSTYTHVHCSMYGKIRVVAIIIIVNMLHYIILYRPGLGPSLSSVAYIVVFLLKLLYFYIHYNYKRAVLSRACVCVQRLSSNLFFFGVTVFGQQPARSAISPRVDKTMLSLRVPTPKSTQLLVDCCCCR